MFKVAALLESARVTEGKAASNPGDPYGFFVFVGPCAMPMKVIASDGVDPEAHGWEHVSVSCLRRPPNWQEMCFVKDLFWDPEDCVIQFHPPPHSVYVNVHQNVLHLWRHKEHVFPMPPVELV